MTISRNILPIDKNQLEIPVAVRLAQQQGFSSSVEKNNKAIPKTKLFFSFDIVNSTVYKANTAHWPIIIKGFLEYIRRCVQRDTDLEGASLWRVIGDEMVFVHPIYSMYELYSAVDAVFRVTQRLSLSIHTGKFFETLEEQKLQKREIDVLKSQDVLSVKSAAWIAVINREMTSPYDNIEIEYPSDASNMPIVEYLGQDMDTGFRLKSYTQPRRLVVSFEIACLLNDFLEEENPTRILNILDYKKLKGVWNNSLYPIIWYYNEDTLSEVIKSFGIKGKAPNFSNSFYYDEAVDNELAQCFLERRCRKSNTDNIIKQKMYRITTACHKICDDKNLRDKLAYLKSTMRSGPLIRDKRDQPFPLELHCAVVCCNSSNNTILICRRGSNHSRDCDKWEFGCAKASGGQSLISSISDYYRDRFGIEIELVRDDSRDDKQPVPLAIYEIPTNKDGATKKGVIFIARAVNPDATSCYRGNTGHIEIRWVTKEEISKISKKEAILDFHNTAYRAFEKWEEFFGVKSK